MDERKLEELFRDSVRTVPPASFDEGDVASASRRITARRRMTATVGGTAVAAAVLVGGIGVGSGWFSSSTDTVASPPPVAPLTAAPAPVPQIESDGITPRSGGCRPDPSVVAAVEATLPEAGGTRPTPVLSCPTGAKAAAFPLRDGPAAGRVTVLVSPAGTAQAGQSTPGDVRRPDGAQQSVRKARSGKLVVVVSEPEQGSPAAPFGTRLAHVAGDLAARF